MCMRGPYPNYSFIDFDPQNRSLYSFSTSGFSKKCVTFFVGGLHHLLSTGGFESNKNQAFIVLQWNRIFGVYSFRV